MLNKTYIYIFIMAAVIFAIRVIPVTLIKKQIENRFIKSFLYYLPYVTLAVMTFPAMINATESVFSGILALAAGITAAWLGADLFYVSVLCCLAVFVCELFIV